jgi:ribose transport system substrate-binding protein
MKRKWILIAAMVIVVSMVFSLSLAGCKATTVETTAAATTAAAEETTAAAEETTAAAETTAALPVVGIANGYSGNSWRNIMIAALEEVGDEYKAAGKIADYKIVNNVTQGDASEQANIIRDFISEGVNIIMVNPNSPDALNSVIKEAQDAGIMVVAFDATVTAPDVLNVTLDHYAWNTKNVEFIFSTLQKGNAIEIYGMDGHPANNERMRATTDVLAKYPDIKMLTRTTGYWDQTKAKEVATQIIGGGQQIDGVVTQDSMAFGVLSAFLDANKLPKVMFADPGTAFFKEWKKLRDEGADFKACAQANPPGIGGTAFRMAIQMYNGKEFKPGILTDTTYFYQVGVFITDENFDEGWAVLQDKPDDYLLSEIMTEDKVAELFQ